MCAYGLSALKGGFVRVRIVSRVLKGKNVVVVESVNGEYWANVSSKSGAASTLGKYCTKLGNISVKESQW